MINIFNEDFSDFISCFNRYDIDYIIVGGMAVIMHGHIRSTGDMDVWVRKDKANYNKILSAFRAFGMPVFNMSEEQFLSDQFDVWGFGRQPVKIELMTTVKGLDFDEAFAAAQYYTENDVTFRFLNLTSLIQAKKAAGRHKDIDDIEQLSKK